MNIDFVVEDHIMFRYEKSGYKLRFLKGIIVVPFGFNFQNLNDVDILFRFLYFHCCSLLKENGFFFLLLFYNNNNRFY